MTIYLQYLNIVHPLKEDIDDFRFYAVIKPEEVEK